MNSGVQCLLDLDRTITLSTEASTDLINRHNQLLKKYVADFCAKDIRFLIGQGTSLEILVLLATELLTKSILIEGNYFEGGLLPNVVSREEDFWSRNSNWYNQICELINKSRTDIESIPLSKLVEKRVSHFLGVCERINFVSP